MNYLTFLVFLNICLGVDPRCWGLISHVWCIIYNSKFHCAYNHVQFCSVIMWSGEVSSVLWATFTELGFWVLLAEPAKQHLMRSLAVLERFHSKRQEMHRLVMFFFGFFWCSKRTQGQTSLMELVIGTGSYRRVTFYSDIACQRPQGFTLPTMKWMSRVWGICAWVLWGKWWKTCSIFKPKPPCLDEDPFVPGLCQHLWCCINLLNVYFCPAHLMATWLL